MGKNKLLDTSYKTLIKNKKQLAKSGELIVKSIKQKTKDIKLYGLCTLLFAMYLSACSLPKIIVLDDPLSPEEHLNLGVTYEKKGELENALEEYKKASKKLPMAYLYMGNVYFQKNEFDKAEFYYKKTIKKDPENADAYNNLAWLYFIKKENLDEAEKLALKAIELNPEKKEIYLDTLGKIKILRNTY